MEEEAKRLMRCYKAGNLDEIQKYFANINKNEIRNIFDNTKSIADNAYKISDFKTAIELYTQCIASLSLELEYKKSNNKNKISKQASFKNNDEKEKKKELAVIYSNRSACYLQIKDYRKALKDAQCAIQCNSLWHKGWYRAGRVLYMQGRYDEAEKVFKASKKFQQTENKEIEKWIVDSHERAIKKKMIQRVTVDYRRFEDILDDDEHQEHLYEEASGKARRKTMEVEYATELTEEQQKQLDAFIYGETENIAIQENNLHFASKFDPNLIFIEFPEVKKCQQTFEKNKNEVKSEIAKKEQCMNNAILGLCSYLQFVTEFKEIKKISASTDFYFWNIWQKEIRKATKFLLPNYTNYLKFILGNIAKQKNEEVISCNFSLCKKKNYDDFNCEDLFSVLPSLLFIGTGTCVGVIAAAKELKKFKNDTINILNEEKLEEKNQKFDNSTSNEKKIKGHDEKNNEIIKPVIACTNKLNHIAGLACKRMCIKNNVRNLVEIKTKLVERLKSRKVIENNENNVYEELFLDVHMPAAFVAFDLNEFDEILIGKQILHLVKFVRKYLAVEYPIILPSRGEVYVQMANVRVEDRNLETNLNFNLLNSNRWSAFPEKIDFFYENNFYFLSEKILLFSFDFDAPLHLIDEILSLRDSKTVNIKSIHSGEVNCFVFSIRLHGCDFDSYNSNFIFKHNCFCCSNNVDDQGKNYEIKSNAVHNGHGETKKTVLVDTTPPNSVEQKSVYYNIMGESDIISCKNNCSNVHTNNNIKVNMKNAVQWIDPFYIEKDDVLNVLALRTSTSIKLKILNRNEQSLKIRSFCILDSEFNILRNRNAFLAWRTALSGVINVGLQNVSIEDDVYETKLKKVRRKYKNYEILCVNGSIGVVPMLCSEIIANYCAKLKHKSTIDLHITSVDNLSSNISCTKELFKVNQTFLHEDLIEELFYSKKNNYNHDVIEEHEKQVSAERKSAQAFSVICNKKRADIWLPLNQKIITEEKKKENDNDKNLNYSKHDYNNQSKCDCDQKNKNMESLDDRIINRISILQKDIRQIRPPKEEDYEEAESAPEENSEKSMMCTNGGSKAKKKLVKKNLNAEYDLFAAQMYDLPMGVDLSKSLPPPNESDFIKTKANLCILNSFDAALIGEGILTIGEYITKFLMKKKRALAQIIPFKAKVYAVAVELSSEYILTNTNLHENERQKEGEDEDFIDISVWKTYRYSPENFSLNLDSTKHKILTEPFFVYQFNFDQKSLSSFSPQHIEKEITIKQKGNLNAFILYYDLYLDLNTIISNIPLSVKKLQKNINLYLSCKSDNSTTDKREENIEIKKNNKVIEQEEAEKKNLMYIHPYGFQSCQIVQEILVEANSKCFISIEIETSKISINFNEKLFNDFNALKTDVLLYDTLWIIMNKKFNEMNQTISANIYQNQKNYKQTLEASLRIAVDAGNYRDFRIDPQEANFFFKTLFV